jgi:hypothetical protein
MSLGKLGRQEGVGMRKEHCKGLGRPGVIPGFVANDYWVLGNSFIFSKIKDCLVCVKGSVGFSDLQSCFLFLSFFFFFLNF